MLIVHEFTDCLHCGASNEIFTEDHERGDVECYKCHYVLEFSDIRMIIYEEEF